MLSNEKTTKNLKVIRELEARKYGSEISERIKQQVVNLKKLEVIEQATKLTNSKKITVKSKELAKELITEDYIRRFDDELKLLTSITSLKSVCKSHTEISSILYVQ